MVQGSTPTYRLRADLLEDYLRTQFPGHTAFNVQLSADGKQLYTFDTPSALTQAQQVEIDENVRLKPEDDMGFL
ncbi:hypothetical protein NEMBOFW57_002068 [Staphylotrichum longicolle]|uniref:Uncharacterized protein n=1 Tax=Staphylotrichum longicolle TaxID=669026 RepID=A0AAD4I1F3_9PEZI|nr:hypothetical protein NEMBOFW57_002068 [Staphylotrichum longicolle]